MVPGKQNKLPSIGRPVRGSPAWTHHLSVGQPGVSRVDPRASVTCWVCSFAISPVLATMTSRAPLGTQHSLRRMTTGASGTVTWASGTVTWAVFFGTWASDAAGSAQDGAFGRSDVCCGCGDGRGATGRCGTETVLGGRREAVLGGTCFYCGVHPFSVPSPLSSSTPRAPFAGTKAGGSLRGLLRDRKLAVSSHGPALLEDVGKKKPENKLGGRKEGEEAHMSPYSPFARA